MSTDEGDVQDVLGRLLTQVVGRYDDNVQRDEIAARLDLTGLSKTARKKAITREIRRQQFQETRKQEKARAQKRSRERNRAAWEQRRVLIESGKLTEAEALADAVANDTGRIAKKVRLERQQRLQDAFDSDQAQRVVIDCAFDDVMSDKELISFRHQIRILYGSNKRADTPVKLFLTGMSPDAVTTFAAESQQWLLHQKTECYTQLFPIDDLVYLSADAPQTVDVLDPGKVYVIGGLVDHNRLKGICHDKAVSQGVAVRSLPISEYLQGSSRRVLTVNQVFDILVQYGSCHDWRQAFERVIPPRKGFKPKE